MKADNKNGLSKNNPVTEFLLYKTPNGEIKVDVLLQNEKVGVSILEHTTPHGAIKEKTQLNKTKLYNLDAFCA